MDSTRNPAIMLRGLRKSYGQVTALDGLSLAVRPGSITGLREMPISDITFSNVHLRAETGFACTNASGVTFLDTSIHTTRGEALLVKDCDNIRTERLERSTTQPNMPAR